MREPSARHALVDTVTICEGTSSRSLSARKTRYAVISLVSDAGSRGSSAFCATSVWPLSTSTSRYALAARAGGGTAAADTPCASALAATQRSASTSKKWRKRDIGKNGRKARIIPSLRFSLRHDGRCLDSLVSQEREGDVGLASGDDLRNRLPRAGGHRPTQRAVAGVQIQVRVTRPADQRDV